MSTTVQHESARIYTFTKRAKTKVEKYSSHTDQANSLVSLDSRRPAVASGSGWYHEAAIEEAERDGNKQ